MGPLAAVLIILAVFLVLATLFARVDGLAFMAPASTRRIRPSAKRFCTDACRTNGICPLTGTAEAAADCPLFAYIRADVPTAVYGSPFETMYGGSPEGAYRPTHQSAQVGVEVDDDRRRG